MSRTIKYVAYLVNDWTDDDSWQQ